MNAKLSDLKFKQINQKISELPVQLHYRLTQQELLNCASFPIIISRLCNIFNRIQISAFDSVLVHIIIGSYISFSYQIFLLLLLLLLLSAWDSKGFLSTLLLSTTRLFSVENISKSLKLHIMSPCAGRRISGSPWALHKCCDLSNLWLLW